MALLSRDQGEVISIHIGGAGIRVGDAAWSLMEREHRVGIGMKPMKGVRSATPTLRSEAKRTSELCLDTAFCERKEGVFAPRALFIDTDSEDLDEVRCRASLRIGREAISDMVLAGTGSDTGGIFSRGYHLAGGEMVDKVLERVRRMAGECDSLQGFMIYSASGGGTGSGLCAAVAEGLSVSYKGRPRIGVTLLPSKVQPRSTVEPYNGVFAAAAALKNFDANIVLQNGAIQKALALRTPVTGVRHSFGDNVNMEIGGFVSDVTAPFRAGAGSLTSFTKLVPYPVMNTLMASTATGLGHECVGSPTKARELIRRLWKSARTDPKACLAECDHRDGVDIATAMFVRGEPRSARGIEQEVHELLKSTRDSATLRDWIPHTFSASLVRTKRARCQNSRLGPPGSMPLHSVTMLTNNSAIQDVYSSLTTQFDILFAKRAFVHWYEADGTGLDDFGEAREAINVLALDYGLTETVDSSSERSMPSSDPSRKTGRKTSSSTTHGRSSSKGSAVSAGSTSSTWASGGGGGSGSGGGDSSAAWSSEDEYEEPY